MKQHFVDGWMHREEKNLFFTVPNIISTIYTYLIKKSFVN